MSRTRAQGEQTPRQARNHLPELYYTSKSAIASKKLDIVTVVEIENEVPLGSYQRCATYKVSTAQYLTH